MKFLIRFIFLVLLGFGCSGCSTRVYHVENPEDPHQPATTNRVKHLNHIVRPGETLSRIAVHYYGTYQKFDVVGFIRRFNGIPDGRSLQTGEIVKIPYILTEGKIKPDSAAINETESKIKPGSAAIDQTEANIKTDSTAINRSSRSQEKPLPPPEKKERSEAAAAAEAEPDEENLSKGLDLLNTGRYSEAISKLEKAFEAHPADPDIEKHLYTAYFQQAVDRFEAGDYPAAQTGFQKVIKYRTDCLECIEYAHIISEKGKVFLIKGIGLFKEHKYPEAISALSEALALAPENERITEYLYKAHFELAQEYYRVFQISRDKLDYLAAQKALKESRKHRKDCLSCTEYEDHFKQKHYNKGIELYTQKESEGVDDAIREWERVLFVDPRYKKVKENIEEASTLLRKLRDLNEKNGRTSTYGGYEPSTWDSTTVTLSAPPASLASSMNPSTFCGNEISDVSTSRIRISSTMSVSPSEQSR